MSFAPSSDSVCQAILQCVTDGVFPESDNLVSSEFPLDIIPTELQELANAKKVVESEISALSKETATSVDDWITQAKRLHLDIEKSRLAAREIVALHERGREHRDRVLNANSSVNKLREEIALSENLLKTLEEVRLIDHQLAAGQSALGRHDLLASIELLDDIEQTLTHTPLPQGTSVIRLLSVKASEFRTSIAAALEVEWKSLLTIEQSPDKTSVAVKDFAQLSKLLLGLSRLQVLDSIIASFENDFVNAVLQALISPTKSGPWRNLTVNDGCLESSESSSKPLVGEILDSLLSAFTYLKENLPPVVVERLLKTLAATIVKPLTVRWLIPSVPTSVPALDTFQGTLDQVRQFTVALQSQGWQGLEELVAWVEQLPRLWLSQRRAGALDHVRQAMSHSSGKIKKVERVEKECVAAGDALLGESIQDDDWDAEWSDNEDESSVKNPGDSGKPPLANNETAEDQDDAESWDWEEENDESSLPAKPKAEEPEPQANGHGASRKSTVRELILKEVYAITDLPDRILAIISEQISDAENLARLADSQLALSSSKPALLALPTFITAMFKATAPIFYSHRFNMGQMYLYNDCMYLAEQLRALSEAQNLPKLTSDAEAIEKFGKAAYGKELQAQRTILTDLLDGCQGFSNCSEEPFLGECKNAISAAVDRMREVYNEWQPILSHSALLQSIGALLASAVSKLILDIEDLSDISDAESRRLAEFCTSLSKLEDIFLPDPVAAKQADPLPMTAIYVHNWLKFQYLINILEGSLADIKYLWTEGELKLEFEVEEVVDLITALFADSEHRKRAIAEIRRTPNVS